MRTASFLGLVLSNALAVLLICPAALPSVAHAQAFLPMELAGKRFKDYDFDDIQSDVFWLCRNGAFALRNGVSMSDDENPGRYGDGVGSWTVLQQGGGYFLSLTYQNGAVETFPFMLDQNGNVIVLTTGKRWLDSGGAGC